MQKQIERHYCLEQVEKRINSARIRMSILRPRMVTNQDFYNRLLTLGYPTVLFPYRKKIEKKKGNNLSYI